MMIRRIATWLLPLMLMQTSALAQTPVANRVKAVIKHLPQKAEIVAKYTDNDRHCLYYLLDHRLYCYDVIKDKNGEVSFGENYLKVEHCYVISQGKMLFVSVDRGSLSKTYAKDGKRLYMINPLTRRIKTVGSGYDITKTTHDGNECFSVKTADGLLNPDASADRQQWIAREHFYDIDGSALSVGKEYKIRIAKK